MAVHPTDTKTISFRSMSVHKQDVDKRPSSVPFQSRIEPKTFNHNQKKILHTDIQQTPINTSTTQNMSPWLVNEEDRHKYGLRGQEVIATSQKAEDVLVTGFVPNPFWHSFQKSVAAVHTADDEQYIQCFENELRLPLKAFLISSLPNCSWILNVLHLGFGADKYANPIVIHVCVQTPHYFTSHKVAALEVVQGMEKIIKEKLDNQKYQRDMHEKFHIDICQIYHPKPKSSELKSKDEINKNSGTELRSSDSTHVPGVILTENFPDVYLIDTPCPGLSVGRRETKDRTYPAGSLTGFLQQENTLYSLTCSHVAFPDPERSSEIYKYNDGMEQFKISIPAFKDHKATLQVMEYKLKHARIAIEKAEKRQVMCPEMDFSSRIQCHKEEEIRCARHLKEAQKYSIQAGYVYAASEGWRTVATFNGILDWALIRNACLDPSNQLPPFYFLEEPQVLRFIEKFGDKYWSSDERKAFITKCQALQDSIESNVSHPRSFSLLNEKSIYFKASSRTTGWKACEMNVVQAIVHNQNSTSDEHVFVSDDTQKSKEKTSEGGDSGGLIYSIGVDIEGNTVLVPMAMIWAGNTDGFEGFQGDVTYATPIEEVLKDIECEMGWESGSLKFC
ncbi:uncharacterized protein Bfra_009992 [Botrytis fragariae]|uniref:Uncharacterized protein n=1 Tax=Botrytis fragariae TaxID=1964551 RepID=A0A8H6EFU9_9HELO|nr:uncharacterized protein Bfra_009992 [Botrytis fragariae]KAF5870603.1 hypothetical protein Bfra_009992 [Botrytis fragariae]